MKILRIIFTTQGYNDLILKTNELEILNDILLEDDFDENEIQIKSENMSKEEYEKLGDWNP